MPGRKQEAARVEKTGTEEKGQVVASSRHPLKWLVITDSWGSHHREEELA